MKKLAPKTDRWNDHQKMTTANNEKKMFMKKLPKNNEHQLMTTRK